MAEVQLAIGTEVQDLCAGPNGDSSTSDTGWPGDTWPETCQDPIP